MTDANAADAVFKIREVHGGYVNIEPQLVCEALGLQGATMVGIEFDPLTGCIKCYLQGDIPEATILGNKIHMPVLQDGQLFPVLGAQ